MACSPRKAEICGSTSVPPAKVCGLAWLNISSFPHDYQFYVMKAFLRSIPALISSGSILGGLPAISSTATTLVNKALTSRFQSSSETRIQQRNPLAPGLLEALTQVVGPDRISTARAVLNQHGTDESYLTPVPPDAVRGKHIQTVTKTV